MDTDLLLFGWPRWGVMWGVSFAIYAACKLLTLPRAVRQPVPGGAKHAYLVGWPGMDPERFLRPAADKRVAPREWAFAAAKLGFGGLMLWGVVPALLSSAPTAAGWAGMIGLVFLLHFGLFHLLACGWRVCGLNAVPIMEWPVLTAGLSEFWGRRWNRAFRDLTHDYLFEPLRRRCPPGLALAAGFAVSGLVHDLVISGPAGGGYGRPTLYFLISAAGLLFERSGPGRRLGLRGGWRGRLFAAAVLIVPLPLLLHPPFVGRVIVPFLRVLNGLS